MSDNDHKPAVIEGRATEAEPAPGESHPDRPLPAGVVAGEVMPIPRAEGALMPLPAEQVVEGMRAYQKLLKELLEPSDWQTHDKDGNRLPKPFLKKSGWRKISRAFNLSFARVHSRVERDEDGTPVRAEVWIRAVAPNGQYGDGDGYCSADEGRFKSWKGRQKLENDLRATACVPLRAEILTREGFRAHNEVREGDLVLAYDLAADRCRWTRLRGVSVYRNAKLVRLGNKQTWSALCTPDHSWAIEHDRPRTRVAQRRLANADRLPARGRVINAAPADSGPRSVSERDAAILGWLITDGRVTWQAFYPRAVIYQSKQPHVQELRTLLGEDAREDFDDRPPRTFPTGQTYPVKRAFRWTLTSAALRDLMERTGVHSRRDLIPFATHIGSAARRAMLDAMLKAEASRSNGGWSFCQVARDVLDVFEILATLEGRALGRERREGKLTRVTLRSGRMTDIARLTVEPEVPGRVWCPTTDYGTWVMRLDGLVSITGNTTRAKNRAIADLVGMGEVSFEEIAPAGEEDEHTQALAAGARASDELARRAFAALAQLLGDGEPDREAAKRVGERIAKDHGYLPVAVGRALCYAATARTAAQPKQEPPADRRAAEEGAPGGGGDLDEQEYRQEATRVLELARQGGYRQTTLRALCELLYGRDRIEQLAGLDLRQLGELLRTAIAGGTGDDTLRRAAERAAAHEDRNTASAALRRWLAERSLRGQARAA